MSLSRFKGSGSTPSRRRFWDSVFSEVTGSKKLAGKNVTVDVHPSGTVINVNYERGQNRLGQPPGQILGACCFGGECSVTTAGACEGTFYPNQTCDDIDCTHGACC